MRVQWTSLAYAYIYVTHTLRMLHQLGGVWHECVMGIAYSAQ
jgi:hypothetical protein